MRRCDQQTNYQPANWIISPIDVYKGHLDHYAAYQPKGTPWPSNYIPGEDTKRSVRPPAPMTHDVVLRHLRGEQSVGVYHVDDDHKVSVGQFDVDDHDGTNPNWRDDVKLIFDMLKDAFGVPPLTPESQSRSGAHVDLPFSDHVEAWKLRRVVKKLVETRLPEHLHAVEFFPKQDAVGPEGYGNQCRLPLWKGSQFVDPENGFGPIDPIEALEGVDKVDPQVLDDLFSELFQGDDVPAAPAARDGQAAKPAYDGPVVATSATAMMEGCAFAQHIKEDAATLGYVPWYIGAGLFARTEGGPALFHELSKLYTLGKDTNSTKLKPRSTKC